MKNLVLLAFCVGLAGAHPADPQLLLAKYTLYGKSAIISSPSVSTESSGKGWIGSDTLLTGSGSTTMYGPIKVGGLFQAQGGKYYGSIDVLGNLTNSGGAPTFGQVVDGPDSLRYNGTIPSSYSGAPILDPGHAKVEIPVFPQYAVRDSAGKNCTLNSSGWSGTRCPIQGQSASTPLPPGSYGDVIIASGAKGIFQGGNYELSSLTVYDTLLIDKAPKEMCRLLLRGNFALKQTNVGALLTKQPLDYGRVLLYVDGSVETQQGQTLMATLLAKNAVVSLNPNFKVYGQVLAKQVNLSNGFNGAAGSFVPFQPLGISYVGPELFDENDNTPQLFRDNSRLVEFPVQLQSTFASEVRVSFRLSSSTISGIVWGANGDWDSTSARGAFASGVLTFAPGQVQPQKLPSLWLNDDAFAENDKDFKLELWGASPADSVAIEGADSLTGLSTWLLRLHSDDPVNQKPGQISISPSILDENSGLIYVGKLSSTDPDPGQNLVYSLMDGPGFRIQGDSLWALQSFDFEKDSTVRKLRIRVEDRLYGQSLFAGTDSSYTESQVQVLLQNLNDLAPMARDDSLVVDEGALAQGLSSGAPSLLDNDTDLDHLGALRLSRILQNPHWGTLNVDSLGHFQYAHGGSEHFADSAWVEIKDSLYKGAQWMDSAWLRIAIRPVNDQAPQKLSPLGTVQRLEDFTDTLSFDLQGRYTDGDGDLLVYTVEALGQGVQWGRVGDQIRIWSKPDSNGLTLFRVKISDGLVSHDLWDTLRVEVLEVNDAPRFRLSEMQILEDAGPKRVDLSQVLGIQQVANEQNQRTQLFLLASKQPGIYKQAPVLDSSGVLSYEVGQDLFGADTLEFLLRDDGGVLRQGVDSSRQSVRLLILPVNDAPSYVRGADTLVYDEDVGKIVLAWADSLRAGPWNESAQQMHFVMDSTPSPLLLQPAWLDSLGRLHFETAANQNGYLRLRFYLQDEGGTQNGGVNRSAADSLLLWIRPVNDLPEINNFDLVQRENAPELALIDSGDFQGSILPLGGGTAWTMRDVDGDTLHWDLQDSVVESGSWGFRLRAGVKLDYERQKYYPLRLRLVAGVDTVWKDLGLKVLNQVELTQVLRKAVRTDLQVESALNDTLWTNASQVQVVWDLDAMALDTSVVALESGKQSLVEKIWQNPSKDSSGRASLVVRANQRAPEASLNPLKGKIYERVIYLSQVRPQLSYKLARMDANLQWVQKDTVFATDWGEGEHELLWSARDVYGNESSFRQKFVVDTTAPKVLILDLKNGEKVATALLPLKWSVDGALQDSLLSEGLKLGENTLVRKYEDSAGNVGQDQVKVVLDLNEGSAQLKILSSLVQDGSALAELAEQRADASGHELLPDQSFSLVLVDPSGNQGQELVYGSPERNIWLPLDQSRVLALESKGHLGVEIALNLPLSGGHDQAGNLRDGLCPDGKPMWKEGIERIELEIYDQSGQFVRRWIPWNEMQDLNSEYWQDDRGDYRLRMELLPADGVLRAENGQRWATGVYLIRMNLRAYAQPQNCFLDRKAQIFKISKMQKVGFRRMD